MDINRYLNEKVFYMKKIGVLIMISFFSTLSYACPYLEGKYTCGENLDVEIAQHSSSDGLEYSIVINADNTVSYTAVLGKIVISDQPQSSESPMRIIAESTCENNLLVTEFLAIIEGERFVDKYFVSFAKTNDGFGLVMRSSAGGNDTFKCIEK